MSRSPLTDEQLAAALLAPLGQEGEDEPCRRLHEDLIWQMVRGGLTEELKGEILDHIPDCPDCALALRVARETSAASRESEPLVRARSGAATLRDLLARTLLHPIPAAAYLVLLALSFPLYRGLTAPQRSTENDAATAGLRGLRVLSLTGDVLLRGEPVPAPLQVRLEPAEALVLRLSPDPENLPQDPGATLVVRVFDGTSVLAEARVRVGDLDRESSLSLLLDSSLLRGSGAFRVELTAGDSLVLKQSFRVETRAP